MTREVELEILLTEAQLELVAVKAQRDQLQRVLDNTKKYHEDHAWERFDSMMGRT